MGVTSIKFPPKEYNETIRDLLRRETHYNGDKLGYKRELT